MTDTGSSREPATERGATGGADASGGIGRVFLIALALAFALAPLISIVEDVALVTGMTLAPAGLGLTVLVGAVLLGYCSTRSATSFGVFAIVTQLCWFAFTWATGVSAQRLELAPSTLLAEALIFVAAVAVAITLAFRTDR